MSQKITSEGGRNAAYVQAFSLLEKYHGGDKSVEKEMREEFARLLKSDENKGPIDGLLCGLVVLEGYDPSIVTDAFGDAGDYRRQTLDHVVDHAERAAFKIAVWSKPAVRRAITAYRTWLANQGPPTSGGRKGILAFVTEPTSSFVCDGSEEHCPAARWAASERRESGEAGEDAAVARAKVEADLGRLKAAKSEAVAAEDFAKAGELKVAIAAAEEKLAELDSPADEAKEKPVDKTGDLKAVITGELERLKIAKSKAVAAEDYVRAGELKAAIAAAEEKLAGLDSTNGSGSKNTATPTAVAPDGDTEDAELAKAVAVCEAPSARGSLKKLIGRYRGGTLTGPELVRRVNEIAAR